MYDRIIDTYSLDDVAVAFSQRFRYRGCRSTATVAERGEDIQIIGTIRHGQSEVGAFERLLRYRHGHARAYHKIFELKPSYRNHDIAKAHYRRCFSFYDRTPIRYVELDADGDGAWVWPLVGFNLTSRKDRLRLTAIAINLGITGLAPGSEAVAADIVTSKVGSRAIGIEALQELRVRAGRMLPMAVDLDDESTRRFLYRRGIIRTLSRPPRTS